MEQVLCESPDFIYCSDEQMYNKENPLYHYHERLPTYKLLLHGFQYTFIVVSWQFVTLSIVSSVPDANEWVKTSILSTTLLTCSLITWIQARGVGWIGGKQLVPPSSNPAYMGASLLAVHTGGLGLLYGMTLFSGALEMLASPFVRFTRHILTTDAIAAIVILIGFEVSGLGLLKAFRGIPEQAYTTHFMFVISIIFLILWIQTKSKTLLQHFAYIIAAILGSVVYFMIDKTHQSSIHTLKQATWIQLPRWDAFGHWQFDTHLIIPFAVASLISICKVTGSVSILQQIHAQKMSTDFTNISRANLADGLGTFLCGAAGGTGINASTTCVALCVSSNINNQYIAYLTAFMLAFCALCGKLMFLFLLIPHVVLGALLIMLGSTLILHGLKMGMRICSQDKARMIIFCLALILGLSRGIFPHFYTHLPILVRMFTGSVIATGTVFLILSHIIRQIVQYMYNIWR